MIPNGEDFEREIEARLDAAQAAGLPHVEVESGDVHRKLGGYPGPDHRMANCCRVMRKVMNPANGDVKVSPGELDEDNAHYVVRYYLPRRPR